MEGSTNHTHPFTDSGIKDIGLGVALFDALKINPAKLADDNFLSSKVQRIAQFLEGQPDPQFLITRLVNSNKSPNIDNIDHFVSFINLETERVSKEKELDLIEDQLRHYE